MIAAGFCKVPMPASRIIFMGFRKSPVLLTAFVWSDIFQLEGFSNWIPGQKSSTKGRRKYKCTAD